MKSLRFTTCMLSTVVYQSTIGGMLAERSTKWANNAGAMGLESRVRGERTVSMGDLLDRHSTPETAKTNVGAWTFPPCNDHFPGTGGPP
jgi:hypothetical protein